MGSVGEQAFGQAKNGYNGGKWDIFNVNNSLQTISAEINRVRVNDNANRNTLTQISNIEKKLDGIQKDYNSNPNPDIMSKNQVQEAKQLQQEIDKQRERLDRLRKQVDKIVKERNE